VLSVNKSIADAGGLPGQVGDHFMRRCTWCNNKTHQNVAHVDDKRPFYALCDECLKEFMSRESVWSENGSKGGSGYFYRADNGMWTFASWKDLPLDTRPMTRLEAIELIKKWKKVYKRQYALVQCSQCHEFHPTTGIVGWDGHICPECQPQEGMTVKCAKCGAYTINYSVTNKGVLCEKCQIHLVTADAAKKPMPTKGDVRKLPKANSPMWTDQWSVTGSAKEPYIVSHRTNGTNGSTTDEGWACGCMAFTRNKVREDCKHILRVKLFEGIGIAAKQVVPSGHAKEYAEFLKLKAKQKRAAATDPNEIKMVGDTTGRKFR
jgi:ribosomal protein S27E